MFSTLSHFGRHLGSVPRAPIITGIILTSEHFSIIIIIIIAAAASEASSDIFQQISRSVWVIPRQKFFLQNSMAIDQCCGLSKFL